MTQPRKPTGRIGADMGGAFTDFVFMDDDGLIRVD
jgi:N-methylhydantoinase A/oxoprolinase/acetone carboxylase beta subunit